MTVPPLLPTKRPPFDWESAGRELGETLTQFNAIVIAGTNPVATGRVAVGLARAQAKHRRVALGDLFAESPPIQSLVQTEDPHGLVDCFLYGVSLTKIAYEVAEAGHLFVMPSGTEAPPYAEILPNPRWQRLAAGFREMQALLILAAPLTAPRLADLVAVMDGVVLVGDTVPGVLPDARVLGAVHEPRPILVRRGSPRPGAGPAAVTAPEMPRRKSAAIAGVALTLVIAGAALWLAYRPLAKGGHSALGPKPDSTHRAVTAIPKLDSAARDSMVRDSARTDTVAIAPVPGLHVTNPSDSSRAAAFGVELMATNTQAGAIFKLQKDGKNLPAATFAPALIQGARWFKVVSGAYSDREGADSLLAGLKRRNMLLGGESVVRLPFAFLIDSVPSAAVPGMVASYADRGQPVYALRQTDGYAWLLVGAFASIEQSSLYIESLRASGITPVLVYRKGRMF